MKIVRGGAGRDHGVQRPDGENSPDCGRAGSRCAQRSDQAVWRSNPPVVNATLRAMDVHQGLVIIEDKGALDCVIRARLQSAILRAAEGTEIDWGKLL